jgi:rhodanese-related sulfurtransferase
MRRLLYESLLVVAIAAVLAAGTFALRPRVLPLFPPDTPAPDIADDRLFKVIPFERAREMFMAKEALFADARPLIAYEDGHIEGAVHLDPYAFDEWADNLIAATAPDQPIITYCDGPHCTLSHELAEKLTWLGFERVYYLVDGWGVWQANALPVERSPVVSY